MDWGDTAEQAAFRAEVREFVEARLPERYRNDPFDSGEHFAQWVFDRYSEELDLREAAREWARALAERGWVAPAWPAEYGGAGLTSIEQFVFGEEMTRAHAPGSLAAELTAYLPSSAIAAPIQRTLPDDGLAAR